MSQNRLKIIRGHAVANGTSIDADTLLFTPNDARAFFGLGFRRLSTSNGGQVRVRLDLIDAPELRGTLGPQSTFWAKNALTHLCDFLGFAAPVWSVIGAENLNPLSAGACDLVAIGQDKFFRIIALLFPENTFSNSLDWLDEPGAAVTNSLNYSMLFEGFASPAFYTSTPEAIRNVAKPAALSAFEAGRGYQNDKSPLVFTLADIQSDNADRVILPKIWRRMMHFATTESGPDAWLQYIRKHREVLIVDEMGTLTTRIFIQREGDTFTLAAPPHRCTWFPKPGLDTSQILAFIGQKPG